MSESYSSQRDAGASARGDRAEDDESSAQARALLALLVPDADADLLLAALRHELARGSVVPDEGTMVSRDGAVTPAEQELRRVRLLLERGAASGAVQHALNNPLAALLAEAQLLELEPLSQDAQLAAGRIVQLTRRLVELCRRLDGTGATERIG